MSTSEKIEYIKGLVSLRLRIPVSAMEGPFRLREYVSARHIAAYLCRHYTDATTILIAKALGRSNHATIIHATRSVLNQMEVDETFRFQVETLENELENGGMRRADSGSSHTQQLRWTESKAA